MNQVYIHSFRLMTSGCKRPMKLWPLLTPKLSIIAALRKKYNRAKKIVNWSATGTGLLSAACSSASFGSALSVVGIPAAIPLGGVGGVFALASSGLIFTSKNLDSKIKKHQEVVTLAIAKRDTVYRLHSKALNDTKLRLSANSLPIRQLPIRPAETVCQFEQNFSSGFNSTNSVKCPYQLFNNIF